MEDNEEHGSEEIRTPPPKPCWKCVGVEPTMFLYMFAFMLTQVVEDAFYVHKACIVNANLSEEICNNITNSSEKYRVQEIVANFRLWENIASQGVPMFLALFLGSWSDRVGRKLPLLLGLCGSLIFSTMIVVNALNDTWPLETVLWSAWLPCSLTGGNLTVFMAAFSYLADTTTLKNRTFRTTMLEVAYLVPMPVGIAFGSYLFNKVFDRSYAIMFTINACFLMLSIIYTALALEWKTTSFLPDAVRQESSRSWFFELFDWRHAVESIKTLFKPRLESRRNFLLLTLTAMAFYTFQREEKQVVYLYTLSEFSWDVTSFSNFRTVQSTLFIFGLLVGVPFMIRYLSMKDMVVLMIGAVSHSLARIIFCSARNGELFYAGAAIGFLGPTVAPILRSVVSKLVPPSERGKVYAMLSLSDNAVPMVSGVVYSLVYKETMSTFPQSIFLITLASQMIVFFIGLYMHIRLKGASIVQAKDESFIM